MKKSTKVYLLITLVWVGIDFIFWIFPPNYILSGHEITLTRFFIDLGLIIGGWIALKLSIQSGFEGFISDNNETYSLVLIGLFFGFVMGCGNIILDIIFSLGDIHADFPISIPYYFTGALYSETLYKLLPLAMLHWGISHRLLGDKYSKLSFWILSLIISFYEPYSILQLANNPNVPGNLSNPMLVYSLVVVNYAVNVLGCFLFWKRGFLATICLRWGFYISWHIIWPIIHYS